jgi:hypothetical protein
MKYYLVGSRRTPLEKVDMRKNLIIPPTILLFLLGGTFPSELCAEESPSHTTDREGPSIVVEQRTHCMAVSDIRDALSAVLSGRAESKYMSVEGTVWTRLHHARKSFEKYLLKRIAHHE